MPRQTKKNLLAVAGVIATVLGIIGSIPSLLREQYIFATISVIFVIGGIILLAIALGD